MIVVLAVLAQVLVVRAHGFSLGAWTKDDGARTSRKGPCGPCGPSGG